MPASSLSLRSDSRALRRWSRMNSPRSCSRVSSESSDSGFIPRSRRPAGPRSRARARRSRRAARGAGRRARARSRAARSSVDVELVVGEHRQVRERRVDDELLAAVGPVQLDRRRVGAARHACRRDVERPDSALRMRGRSATRSSTRAAALAPRAARPRGSPCAPARAGGSTRPSVSNSAHSSAHRAQVVERRAPASDATGIQDRGSVVMRSTAGQATARLTVAPGRSGTG